MIKNYLNTIKLSSKLKLFFFFGLAVLASYFLLVNGTLIKWHALKQSNIQLNLAIKSKSFQTDPGNPLQHDPIIHSLIKFAQAHQLELSTTQFSKVHNNTENFSCEVAGSYFNTIEFITDLFGSPYALNLIELRMYREENTSHLISKLDFEHEI